MNPKSRAAPARGLARQSQRGVTLIEILIVVALIALLGGGTLFGRGMLESSRLRAAATLIVSGVRVGGTRATSTGKPVRLVFDLDAKQVLLEEAAGSVMLREQGSAPSAGAEAATAAERQARLDADRILEGPRAPRARFRPVEGLGGDAPEEGRGLGGGVEFVSVQTEHDDEPRTRGRAYLYFWPGGVTERASIQLRRSGDEQGLTVTVSSLSGRAKIERGRVELDTLDRSTQESEEL